MTMACQPWRRHRVRSIADSAMEHVRMVGDASAMQDAVNEVKRIRNAGELPHVTVIGGCAKACEMSSMLAANGAAGDGKRLE